jgi:hypothetical protein
MPITITCPDCDSRIRAPDSVEGRPVTCPKCGNHFTATPSPDPLPTPTPVALPSQPKSEPLLPVLPAPPAKGKVEPSALVPKAKPEVPATNAATPPNAAAPVRPRNDSPPAAAPPEPLLKLENWADIAAAPPEPLPTKEETTPLYAPRSPNVLVDFLLFRRLIAPVVIQIFFWFGFVGCVLFGGLLFARVLTLLQAGERFGPVAGYLFGTLAVWFLGPLMVRVACEVLILFFRMNDTLIEIKKATQELPDEE